MNIYSLSGLVFAELRGLARHFIIWVAMDEGTGRRLSTGSFQTSEIAPVHR